MSGHDNEELIDYEDEHDIPNVGAGSTSNGTAVGAGDAESKDKKNFSGIHSTGFRHVPCRFTSSEILIIRFFSNLCF